MSALAMVSDVEARLGEDEVTDGMRTMIEVYLEDASDAARDYGRHWTPLDCPTPVSRLVASAVARFMRNPEFLQQSRAGDETLTFHRREEIDWFTEREIDRLRRIGNPMTMGGGFGSIQIAAWGNSGRTRRDTTWDAPARGPRGSIEAPFPMGPDLLEDPDPSLSIYGGRTP